MIIECKCKKYKFKIPEVEIVGTGRNVKCEICNKEWYIDLINQKSKNKALDILGNINPSKTKSNFKIKNNKNDTNHLLHILVLFFIFFLMFKIAMYFKPEVLQKFPTSKNFYESLEIVIQIIKSYIEFFRELISEKFINL